MKTKTKLLAILLSASIFTSVLLNSCSLVGFGIGASVDSRTPETIKIGNDNIDSLELEKRVVVIKTNGETIYGRYNGIIPIYNHGYSIKYNRIQKDLSSQVLLPNLNDTLLILYKRNKSIRKLGLFKGFESGILWCQSTYSDNHFSICLDSIKNIAFNNGYVIDSVEIQSFVVKHKFPNFICLKIETKEKITENITLISIRSIQAYNSRSAKFVGLGIGLAIDAVIAYSVVNSMQSMTLFE